MRSLFRRAVGTCETSESRLELQPAGQMAEKLQEAADTQWPHVGFPDSFTAHFNLQFSFQTVANWSESADQTGIKWGLRVFVLSVWPLVPCRRGECYHPAGPGGWVSFHTPHHDLQGGSPPPQLSNMCSHRMSRAWDSWVSTLWWRPAAWSHASRPESKQTEGYTSFLVPDRKQQQTITPHGLV